jgi:hypothetical protein
MRYTTTMIALALLPASIVGCGMTVTNERPTFEELEPAEQSAVRRVVNELSRLNAQIKAHTGQRYNIDKIVDKERIHVSFEGLIFSANLGDDTIHVAVWENLTPDQRALVQSWFGVPPAQAKVSYGKFFYEFMAAVQGVKQLMYTLHTPYWIYHHRSLWSVERDSIRTALSFYVADGRRAEMWPFLSKVCGPVKSQYDPLYGGMYDKKYFNSHFREIYDPEEPSGYMYFICRWIDDGMGMAEGLSGELDWLIRLPGSSPL